MINIVQQLTSFPSPFMRAITRDRYSKGDSQFSCTQLINAPKRTWLATKGEKVETPYSSFAALLGTAIHAVLEDNVDPSCGEVAEQRMFYDFPINNTTVRISGQIDFYENRTVFDYKFIGGTQAEMKTDHHKQVQINGLLSEFNGLEVEHVAIAYLQRDWSYMQSTVNPLYPKTPFKIFVTPFDRQFAAKTLSTCVKDHQDALDGNPRDCTDEEMWAKPDSFALMKPGAKRASKLCATMAEAEQEKKPGQFIQVRKGERTFCASFCGFGHICEQYQNYLRDAANQSQEEP